MKYARLFQLTSFFYKIAMQPSSPEEARITLEIDPSAELTSSLIEKHRRKATIKFHPDRNKEPDAGLQLQKANVAADYLLKYIGESKPADLEKGPPQEKASNSENRMKPFKDLAPEERQQTSKYLPGFKFTDLVVIDLNLYRPKEGANKHVAKILNFRDDVDGVNLVDILVWKPGVAAPQLLLLSVELVIDHLLGQKVFVERKGKLVKGIVSAEITAENSAVILFEEFDEERGRVVNKKKTFDVYEIFLKE